MAESNGTTLGVDLLSRDAKLVGAEEALRGESLVDLKDVNVLLGDASELEHLGDGLPGAETHEKRGHTNDGSVDVLAEDGLAELLGGGALHEENGGGTVGNLGGVAGVDAAVLGEGSTDLAEGLDGDTLTDAIVLVDNNLLGLAGLGVLVLDLEGSDLLLEETSLLGLDGLLEGGGSELILDGTGDALGLGHLLREDTHGDLAVGSLGVALEELGELGHGAGAILSGHGLDTGADADLDLAGADGVGNVNAGLETGRALAVEGVDGGGVGEAGNESGSAHLGGATTGGEDGADNDILDQGGVDLGALDDGLEGTSHQVGGGCVLEATLSTSCDGRPEGSGNDDLLNKACQLCAAVVMCPG